MLFSSSLFVFALVAVTSAAPVQRRALDARRVPIEHANEPIVRSANALLQLNNPDKITDAVFGLLGNAAASGGKGNIADPDCLQQAIADQALTNAKAKKDIQGQTDALIYQTLERNTGKSGLASVLCTSIKPKNAEIAAIAAVGARHQDAASPGAAENNKKVALALAQQIATIGGDPLQALRSGTFAPGKLDDPTAQGGGCDDANDANGCINTLGLLVEDVSEAEIQAAVAGIKGGGSKATATATATETEATATATATATDCPPQQTVTVTVPATAPPAPTGKDTPPAKDTPPPPTSGGDNLQKFTGALGGISAPKVTLGGRKFQVEGNSDFLNLSAALGRSCDVQHNKCANAANSGGGFKVQDCDKQNDQCRALIQ